MRLEGQMARPREGRQSTGGQDGTKGGVDLGSRKEFYLQPAGNVYPLKAAGGEGGCNIILVIFLITEVKHPIENIYKRSFSKRTESQSPTLPHPEKTTLNAQ